MSKPKQFFVFVHDTYSGNNGYPLGGYTLAYDEPRAWQIAATHAQYLHDHADPRAKWVITLVENI